MVTANELRIGNEVILKSGEVATVAGVWANNIIQLVTEKGIDSRAAYVQDLSGIPLSSELLEAWDFEKTQHRILGNIWMIPIMPSAHRFLQISQMTPITFLATVFEPNNDVPLIAIKYLHQLQNIFYAVSGRELEAPVPVK